MPKIIAICPYCRRGGVRAKDTAVGAIAHCPKCKSNFTILPEDNLPDWAAKAKPEAESFYQSSSPLAETRATAKLPDRTEPSPTVKADPKPEKKAKAKEEPKPEQPSTPEAAAVTASSLATPQVAPESDSEEALRRAPADMGMVIALLALIMVGPTVLVSQLPYGRIIAIPLAVIGLLGGLLSLGAEGKARVAAAVGAFLHFGALIVLLFLPSWLNLDPWGGPPVSQEEELKKIPVAVQHGAGLTRPLSQNDMVDATRASWQLRDVRVTVRAAAVGPIELHGPNGAKRMTKEHYFHLVLRVTNVGVEREIPLSDWAAGAANGLSVIDANGKSLAPAAFEAGWAPERKPPLTRAVPGHAAEVYLVFTAPPPKTDFVRLRLSGSALGVTDEIQFRASITPLPARGPGK